MKEQQQTVTAPRSTKAGPRDLRKFLVLDLVILYTFVHDRYLTIHQWCTYKKTVARIKNFEFFRHSE